MEYELVFEGEDVLFDASTNPSCEHRDEPLTRRKAATGPQAEPADSRRLQKAELIPEEEQQLA
jgi:hypothetical protein